jgi:hypothetical protein
MWLGTMVRNVVSVCSRSYETQNKSGIKKSLFTPLLDRIQNNRQEISYQETRLGKFSSDIFTNLSIDLSEILKTFSSSTFLACL